MHYLVYIFALHIPSLPEQSYDYWIQHEGFNQIVSAGKVVYLYNVYLLEKHTIQYLTSVNASKKVLRAYKLSLFI